MTSDQSLITLEAMQQMFRESEERLEEKFEQIDRRIDKLAGVMQFLDEKLDTVYRKLDTRIDDLEQNMNKQFKTLANEMIKYADGASSYCHKELDNHETRIIRLEQNMPILLKNT